MKFAAEARRSSEALTISAMARRWDDVLRLGAVTQPVERPDAVAVSRSVRL
jgi:hypothetical protein